MQQDGQTGAPCAVSWHDATLSHTAPLTLVGVNPALDQFTELAAQMKDAAHAVARKAGRALTAAMAA